LIFSISRAASKDPELERAYLGLLKETSIHEKSIIRDLGRYYQAAVLLMFNSCFDRTFPHHDFFTDGQGIGQENLFNVLKAYSLYFIQQTINHLVILTVVLDMILKLVIAKDCLSSSLFFY
jgi:hypothetical protein